MTNHAPRQSIKHLLGTLHAKFGQNIEAVGTDVWILLDKIDLNSRIISEIRSALLGEYCDTTEKQNICTEQLEEVFSDFSLAMYLCSVGLIVQARMSVRRAFELGLATVYMWDLPHEYWGWRSGDGDLSFSAMVAHLNSNGYLEYLKHLREGKPPQPICEQAKFQNIYRELSNTVHGKTSDLPPLSPERFLSDRNGIDKHLTLEAKAQDAIITLLFGRFSGLQAKIEAILPQTKRV